MSNKAASPIDEQSSLAIIDAAGVMKQGTFEFWTTSATGIAISDEIGEDRLRSLTRDVCAMFEVTGKSHAQSAMMLGDILRFWEEKFPDHDYTQEIDSTREYMRVSVKTLENWMWVAGKVEPSRRRENLSLEHHVAVAKLPADEQSEYLRKADNEGMSVTSLKKEIREAHPGPKRANSTAKTTVKIDTEKPSAVRDALEILAKHLTDPETKWDKSWEKFTHEIFKGHKRVFLNGGRKK